MLVLLLGVQAEKMKDLIVSCQRTIHLVLIKFGTLIKHHPKSLHTNF